jgi:hypothetical protein
MVIAFGLGIMTEYSLSNQGNQPVFQVPQAPVMLSMQYKNSTSQNTSDYVIAETPATNTTAATPTTMLQTIQITDAKSFVASKTGTKYYPAGCGGISRIKEENKVYFTTEKDAQDKGYTRTDTCK